jgi:hypothetical protein
MDGETCLDDVKKKYVSSYRDSNSALLPLPLVSVQPLANPYTDCDILVPAIELN